MNERKCMALWERVELSEVLIAAPKETGQFVFSGDMSEMWNYVFSDTWDEYMYDEYTSYFWEDILRELEKRKTVTEIVVDMVYDFGEAEEKDVREYMMEHKDEGPRFLIMPRTDKVAMACAWLRGYVIKDIESL
jgi:hypothetical protein